jgi:hypothetical protein
VRTSAAAPTAAPKRSLDALLDALGELERSRREARRASEVSVAEAKEELQTIAASKDMNKAKKTAKREALRKRVLRVVEAAEEEASCAVFEAGLPPLAPQLAPRVPARPPPPQPTPPADAAPPTVAPLPQPPTQPSSLGSLRLRAAQLPPHRFPLPRRRDVDGVYRTLREFIERHGPGHDDPKGAALRVWLESVPEPPSAPPAQLLPAPALPLPAPLPAAPPNGGAAATPGMLIPNGGARAISESLAAARPPFQSLAAARAAALASAGAEQWAASVVEAALNAAVDEVRRRRGYESDDGWTSTDEMIHDDVQSMHAYTHHRSNAPPPAPPRGPTRPARARRSNSPCFVARWRAATCRQIMTRWSRRSRF